MTEGPFRMHVAPDRHFAESEFIYKGRESELELHWRMYYCADVSVDDVTFERVRSIIHSERRTSLFTSRVSALVMKIVQSNYNKFNIQFDISIIPRYRTNSNHGSFKNCITRSRGEMDFDIRMEDKFVFIETSCVICSFDLEIVFAMSGSNPQIPNHCIRQSASNNCAVHQQFAEQLKKMYEDKKYTDFSIVVGGKQFDVHKAILASRSPVFNAMFERSFSESALNRLVVSDFEADAVEKFLEFVYTGECDVEEYQAAGDLLACADKYDVDALKSKCEEDLARRLKCDNVVNVLQMADIHRAGSLKEAALKFVSENLNAVMSTPEWTSLTKELLNEILAKIAEMKFSP